MATSAPEILLFPLSRLREILADHYRRLSQASRILRFMGPIGDDGIRRFTEAATPDLVIGIEADGEMRGILELFPTRDPGHAEIGLSIQDAYQGRGYGRALFHRGVEEARARGFTTVDVHYSRSNRAIEKLCLEEGGRIRYSASEASAFIQLDPRQ